MFQITVAQPSGLKFADNNTFVGDLVSSLITYAIIGAGLLFLVRLLAAGFTLLTSAGDSGKMQNATKELTNGIVGLLIVISAFFIAQILQIIFGIEILN